MSFEVNERVARIRQQLLEAQLLKDEKNKLQHLRFLRLCAKANELYLQGRKHGTHFKSESEWYALVFVTRIWNTIDSGTSFFCGKDEYGDPIVEPKGFEDPDKYFDLLKNICPWAFTDPTAPNSIRFVYTESAFQSEKTPSYRKIVRNAGRRVGTRYEISGDTVWEKIRKKV